MFASGKVGWRGSHRRRATTVGRRKWLDAAAFQGIPRQREDGGGDARSKRGRRWGAAELTEGGGNDGAMAAVRPARVDTRPRKDLGATECSGARSRGRTRGKRKGGATTMGHPL
jgi:hypothetical protein